MQKVNTAQEQKHDPTQRMTKKHGFDFSISEKMCKEKHDLHFISEFYISALASSHLKDNSSYSISISRNP